MSHVPLHPDPTRQAASRHVIAQRCVASSVVAYTIQVVKTFNNTLPDELDAVQHAHLPAGSTDTCSTVRMQWECNVGT